MATAMPPPTVLVIDDDERVHDALRDALDSSYAVASAFSGEEGLTMHERVRPDAVLLDVILPQMGGMAVLRALKETTADVAVIMMTAYAEVQTAVQAIKSGAADYVQKPIDAGALQRSLTQIVSRASRRPQPADANVIGASVQMARVWRLVERFGPTDIPILLQGETGTGKGLIAEAIHRVSKRAHAPFVSIDCATIPGELAESELFGYEDGAFTGAGKKKRGRVAFADRGTLFLDEIATLSLGTQAKLLTLIEQQAFLPLGARTFSPMQLDARFVSATNVPLHRASEDGSFRADLFHRLNGVAIELPPLRERDGDVDLLCRHFAEQFARTHGKSGLDIRGDALERLRRYPWPGNVRELQRVMSVAAVLADGEITPADLPDRVRTNREIDRSAPAPASAPQDPARGNPGPVGWPEKLNLREIKEWAGREAQKRIIMELQMRTNVSRQDLARMLGVDPKTLRARLKDITSV
jgi:DNA-binding NtrC family response regulator